MFGKNGIENVLSTNNVFVLVSSCNEEFACMCCFAVVDCRIY